MSKPTEPSACFTADGAALAVDLRARCATLDDFAIWGLDERKLLVLDPFRRVPGLAAALRELASRPKIRRLTPDGVDYVLILFRTWLLKSRTADTVARAIVKGLEKGVSLEAAAAAARFQFEIRRMMSRNTLSVLSTTSLDPAIESGFEPGVEDGELRGVLHAA